MGDLPHLFPAVSQFSVPTALQHNEEWLREQTWALCELGLNGSFSSLLALQLWEITILFLVTVSHFVK